MNRFTTRGKIMSIAKLSSVIMAGLVLFAAAARAQTADRNAADATLVDRVKDAVIKDFIPAQLGR